ncbi:shikimate dehydrogenase [uncultured Acinetobacter sp.]|uniref:shikimate dehydrogenase family protein n=1 Tax=uncultured Acinetobacter sp. TaxID=165433 RepID=UPI00258C09D4|nr:shikimate dehydrogenase [uncultured Acinetobacter sp.]
MIINGATKIIALIGDPIEKAKTPEMLNNLLADKGKLGEYLAVGFHIDEEHLSCAIQGIRSIENFVGAIVTMPHKTQILKLLDQVEPSVNVINASNVFIKKSTGSLYGYNFDGIGFINGLKKADFDVKGKNIVIIGAGGASASISYEVLKNECHTLTIMNRSIKNAKNLKQKLATKFPTSKIYLNKIIQSIDLLINATPIGMKESDPLPISEEIIQNSKFVADCIVTIEETLFLKTAKNYCQTHHGKEMLNGQIHEILELFLELK